MSSAQVGSGVVGAMIADADGAWGPPVAAEVLVEIGAEQFQLRVDEVVDESVVLLSASELDDVGPDAAAEATLSWRTSAGRVGGRGEVSIDPDHRWRVEILHVERPTDERRFHRSTVEMKVRVFHIGTELRIMTVLTRNASAGGLAMVPHGSWELSVGDQIVVVVDPEGEQILGVASVVDVDADANVHCRFDEISIAAQDRIARLINQLEARRLR